MRAFRLSRAAAPRDDGAAYDRSLQAALLESRQRYKDLVEIAGDFAWETDSDGCLVFVSPRGALGYAAAELIGRRAASLLAEGEDDAAGFAAREPVENLRLWLRRADGDAACLRLSAVPVLDAEGRWRGARGICRDVTAAQARDAALARADLRDRLLSHVLRAMRDSVEPAEALDAAASATARALGAGHIVILRAAPDGRYVVAASGGADSAAAESWRDAPLAAAASLDAPVVAGRWLAAAARHRREVKGAIALQALDGRPWDAEAIALVAGVADHLGIAIAQVEAHERLSRMARTDGLTGLLNRRTFYEEAERRWRRARVADAEGALVSRAEGALVYCDLDNFKLVNDHAGHGVGDEALRGVARILADLTRGQDLVARLGGDEFALWLEGADRAGAESKAAAILQAVRALAHMSGDPARPFALSLGIALASTKDADIDAFFARADAAMYAAKQAGKGQIAFAADPAGDAG